MYQVILSMLRTKFAGLSENILSRIATKMAQTATNEEQVKAAVEAYTLQNLVDSYADYRATEASQTAVRNYEQKHGLKDGEKQKPTNTDGNVENPSPAIPTPQAKSEEKTPEWAKALGTAIKALNGRMDKMEGDRTNGLRKQQLASVYSKLPEAMRKPYERVAVDGLNEEEFANLVSEITTEVDGIAKGLTAKGAVFGRPSAGGKTENGELSKEQQEAIAHRDGGNSEGGQPF